jgi:Rps23 Pro-64 3,4-dihydroxylase Tpa1-like proline 4-hydroxylase
MSMSNPEARTGTRSVAVGPEVLPYARMREISELKAQDYAAAQPFPHIVIDDFFDPAVLDRVLAEFPDKRDKNWGERDIPEEVKLFSKGELGIPYYTKQLLYAMNSSGFLQFLEKLTGIPKLIGDPQYEGGGLHQIVPGGKLAIHADFNQHSYYNLDRRLNALVYLNKDWKDEYGGHLELWDKAMTRANRVVAPLFNRMVVFTTTSDSYHGHPNPLTCPPNLTRKSMALYYYTVPTSVVEAKDDRHTTLFQARPGEQFRRSSAKQLARDLTPPALWRLLSRAVKAH